MEVNPDAARKRREELSEDEADRDVAGRVRPRLPIPCRWIAASRRAGQLLHLTRAMRTMEQSGPPFAGRLPTWLTREGHGDAMAYPGRTSGS